MKKYINISNKEEIQSFRCSDWPFAVEEINNDDDSELLSDKIISQTIDTNPLYIEESKLSIKFIDSIKIPEYSSVELSKPPGCLLCHNIFLDKKIHYAVLSGLCDIKTVQYYLMSKKILFRASYIKKHLKHVHIRNIKPPQEIMIKDSKLIVEEQIIKLQKAIDTEELLGNGSSDKSMKLRDQLTKFIIAKESIESNTFNETKAIPMLDVIKRIEQKIYDKP